MRYFIYLLYVIRHKWDIMLESFKRGRYLHGISHDMSKFSIQEFGPYARFFYSNEDNREEFEKALEHHYKLNPHHWQHWVKDGKAQRIPFIHLEELVIDWETMGKRFGNSAKEYYLSKKDELNLNDITRLQLEEILGVENTNTIAREE